MLNAKAVLLPQGFLWIQSGEFAEECGKVVRGEERFSDALFSVGIGFAL